ncbi:MAG: LD-carboxypeptidase [Oscillospiraceae bacterium]|nr:LD-carboxypeptidase [Oscillospiraceae bacterium]
MRYPEFLPQGGTIGFVAPSFGCNIDPYKTAFLAALDRFERLGYGIDLGPNCFEGSGVGISNTPEKCGAELTEYYCSDRSEVLISCGGGELMCETLDHVDFDRVASARPKWYMGYSDNTNFTFLLTTLCDVASIYGPCAASFGMEPIHPALQDALDVLRGKKHTVKSYGYWEREKQGEDAPPTAPYLTNEKLELHSYPRKNMTFSGRLIGGCLDCLVNLLGTCYDGVREFSERYQDDGILWFLESCDLNVMGIRRAIWQMQHAGWLEHVSGFLIGRPLCYGQELLGLDQYRAVLDLLAPYHVPIVMDVDIGHLPPQMPLICGSFATVTVRGNHLTVDMDLK